MTGIRSIETTRPLGLLRRPVVLLLVFALAALCVVTDASAAEPPRLGMTELMNVEAFEEAFFGELPHQSAFSQVPAPRSVDLGGIEVGLPIDRDGVAHAAEGNVFVGATADTGDVVVLTSGAFAVVTEVRGLVEYQFPISVAPGTDLVNRPDGSILHVASSGQVLGMIEPAFAIDETGATHPASYEFDAQTDTLTMKADTSDAEGLVLIDPGWRCKLMLAGLGLVFLLGIIGWFTGTWWAMYAYLKALPYISSGLASTIAKACA